MSDWRTVLAREAGALAVFTPIFAISALFGFRIAKSQVAERPGLSLVSPVSPVPTPTPQPETIVLSLQSNPWFLGFVAFLVIAIVGFTIWRSLRRRGGT